MRPLPGLALIGTMLAVGISLSGCSSGHGAQLGSATTSIDGMQASLVLDPAVDHVHGALIHDGVLLLGTHSGLVEVDLTTGRTIRRSVTQDDLMGLGSDGARLVASGHPGPGSDLPDPLGLISSEDDGRTWEPVSLTGEVDFHGLAAAGSMVAGIGTADGLLISRDGGQTWSPSGVEDARSIAWFQGGLWVATDGGLRTWRDGTIEAVPSTGNPVLALAVDPGGSALWAVRDDGTVWRTTDGLTWDERGAITELEALAVTSDIAYAVTAQRVTVIGQGKP